MARKGTNQRKGTRAERQVAKKFGARAIGGAGKPDFVKRGVRGENKHWKRPVHSGVVRSAGRNGTTHLNASGPGGFTAGARATAKRAGVKLSQRRAK